MKQHNRPGYKKEHSLEHMVQGTWGLEVALEGVVEASAVLDSSIVANTSGRTEMDSP